MTQHRLTKIFTSLILLGVIAALVSFQAAAYQRHAPAAGVIATFDLERTFNSIDQKTAMFAQIPKLQEEFKVENDKRRKEIEQLSKDFELFVRGSAKYQELEEKLQLRTHEFQAFVEFSKVKIETERGRALKNTYLEIRKAVQEMAERNGYALVLVNDSLADIPPGTMEDLNRQIAARRVFYSSVDVTDELIDFMNNKFKMSGGGATTNSSPAANATKLGAGTP